MTTNFASSNVHRISINDIEYHNIISVKEICDVNDLNSKLRRRTTINLLLAPYFSASILSVIVIILFYVFIDTGVVNTYSILFITVFLVTIFIVNIIFYFVQMGWTFRHFANTSQKTYSITANGYSRQVLGRRLNCGDSIHLKSGEDVPADIRITHCKNLKVMNGLFSNKEIETDFVSYSTDEDVLKSNNMLFKGSKIVSGDISGVIINREENTILNSLMMGIKQIVTSKSLRHKCFFTNEYIYLLNKFSVVGSVVIVVVNLFLFVSGYRKWQQIFISIELLSALITETAFLIIMVFLIIGKSKFNNCVLARSDVSASLGCVDIIFIRDMSMLCQRNFIISKLWMDGNVVNGEDVITSFEESQIHHSPTWTALTRASVLCNDANIYPTEEDKPQIQRECDPEVECNEVDESLLLAFNGCESIKKWGGSLARYKQNNKNIIGPMYDSVSNCKLSLHRLNDGDPRLLLVLRGSVVDILNCCSTVLIRGKEELLGDAWKEIITKSYQEMVATDHVVRAFCDFRISPDVVSVDIVDIALALPNKIPRLNLRFIGMISFTRSLKPSINQVITKCKDLGVKLIFLNSNSVISSLPTVKRIDASDINLVADSSYDRILCNNSIVMNADETLSLELIKYSRKRGMVTATVGKDLNDITAMISANIGIVATTKSSNICQQFSDLRIIDEDFLTIVSSVERSRKFLNIIYSVVTLLQFPKISFVIGYLCFTIFGFPIPFNLTSILALELCVLLPVICLCFNGVKDINNNALKSIKLHSNGMFDCGLVHQIGVIQLVAASFSYFVIMALNGFWPRHLLKTRNRWYSDSVNDLMDSYGQEWTYSQRRQLDISAVTIVILTLAVLQITATLTATSNSTIFKKKFAHWLFVLSLLFSLALAFAIVNVGSYFQFLDLIMLRFSVYFAVLPFFIYLICFTEIRKYLYRRFNETEWL